MSMGSQICTLDARGWEEDGKARISNLTRDETLWSKREQGKSIPTTQWNYPPSTASGDAFSTVKASNAHSHGSGRTPIQHRARVVLFAPSCERTQPCAAARWILPTASSRAAHLPSLPSPRQPMRESAHAHTIPIPKPCPGHPSLLASQGPPCPNAILITALLRV